jgi:hypothetical protein
VIVFAESAAEMMEPILCAVVGPSNESRRKQAMVRISTLSWKRQLYVM